MSPVFYEQRPERLFAGHICETPFPSHVHDSVEIICPLVGHMALTISGQQYHVQPGDIAVIFPSVPHSYDEVSPDIEGLTLIFLPDAISEFGHTFRTMLPAQPILSHGDKAQELNVITRNLIKLSRQRTNSLQMAYLHLFLAYLFTCLPLQPLSHHSQENLSYHVLHYISEHFTEPLSLENTAHALGISRIHLSHIFSQQLHINFRQYINTLRIDKATYLLRNPELSITQVSSLCGYHNPRTFHRAFLAQVKMPPNHYRRQLSGGNDLDELEMEG